MNYSVNAIKCNSSRFHRAGYFLVFWSLFVSAGGQNLSELKEEAEYLVFSYLSYMNQIEGIRLVGGPFSPDFISLEWKGVKEEKTIFYPYESVSGCSFGFNVAAATGMDERLGRMITILTDSSRKSLAPEIRNFFGTLPAAPVASEDYLEFVSIAGGKIVRRWKEPCHYVCNVRKVNNKKYQILFTYPFSKDELLQFLTDNELYGNLIVTEEGPKEIVVECSPFASLKKTNLSAVQTFLLFGDFSNEEVLDYYKAVQDSAVNERFIKAMRHLVDADTQKKDAYVYFGKPDYLFPACSVILEKSGDKWEVSRSMFIQIGQVHPFQHSFERISFREKIPRKIIKKYAATLQIGNPPEKPFSPNEIVTHSDVLYLSEVVLRLRGINDYCDFRIAEYNAQEIQVVVGRYSCKDLTFRKYQDRWVLTDHGTCFY